MTNSIMDVLLGPLHTHFLCARSAYAAYLNNGRQFLFAKSLRRMNQSARTLLLEKAHLLPPPLQEDAVHLISHYDIWLELWAEHRRRTEPKLNDVFAFQNAFRYPCDAESRLEAFYEASRVSP